MTFNAAIPQSSDDPSVSQGQILTNFSELDTVFDVDHVPFTSGVGAGGGRHDRVVFNNVAAAPGLASPVSSLFTAADGAGVTQLFFENDTLGANIQRQMTNLTLATSVVAGGTQYTTMSPWGLRFIFGEATITAAGTVITFTTPFPNAILLANISAIDPNPHALTISSRLPTSITARTDSGTHSIYYLAIGN